MSSPFPAITLSEPLSLLESTGTEWGSTRYAELQRCAQAYDLRYEQRVRLVDRPGYFGVGSLVHAGIRACEERTALGLQTAGAWRLPIEAARGLAGEEKPLDLSEEPEELAAAGSAPFGLDEIWEAERLLAAYFATHGEENAGWPIGWRVVALELQLRTEAFGAPLTGAIDTLLETPEGAYVIVDTKTAAQRVPVDQDKRAVWRRGRATRPQFLMQAWMLKESLGLELAPGFIVNHISKAKVPIAERVPLEITDEALERWAMNQKLLNEEWRRAQDTHDEFRISLPVMNYSACAPSMGVQCDYIDYCHGSEQARTSKYKKEETK